MAHGQRSGRRQRHHTAAQRAQVVARFHQSGLSRTQFAHRHGLVQSTLDRWLTEARDARKGSSPVVFSELRLGPPVTGAATAWAVEIVRPDGLIVRCREPLIAGELARLLRRTSC